LRYNIFLKENIYGNLDNRKTLFSQNLFLVELAYRLETLVFRPLIDKTVDGAVQEGAAVRRKVVVANQGNPALDTPRNKIRGDQMCLRAGRGGLRLF
jgi:hypothetical protein